MMPCACGSVHFTRSEQLDCIKRRDLDARCIRWLVAFTCVLILVVALGVNQWLYDDWHCAFMHCRKIIP